MLKKSIINTYEVSIKTIGEVAFDQKMNSAIGYRYDVSFDYLDIPFIPLGRILKSAGINTDEMKIGFANPVGYSGLIRSAYKLTEYDRSFRKLIREYYTNEHFFDEEGFIIRSLKAGLDFSAVIEYEGDDPDKLMDTLCQITRIGVTDMDITGEVKINVSKMRYEDSSEAARLLPLCDYRSLTYTVMLLTPACFYAPYSDGAGTHEYIPGEIVRDEILSIIRDKTDTALDSVRVSNAYISDGHQRLLPTPARVSVVKLDREQLRYRMASGKDYSRVEQDVGLQGTFTYGVQGHFVRYVSPETERIISAEDDGYDALSSGQVFKGEIYGTDEQIRTIAAYMSMIGIFHIGMLSNEGFGEVIILPDEAKEADIETEVLSRAFDVCCISDTLIIGENGMPTVRPEDLLTEIEYVAGLQGRLRLVSRYTGIYRDHSFNKKWGMERGESRCFAMGSILRVEAVGEPVDISPILHTFIGERTADGYGEIITYPAREGYYRLAGKEEAPRYVMNYRESGKALKLGAAQTNDVIIGLIRSRVRAMAQTDIGEYLSGMTAEELFPWELIENLRDRFDPDITREQFFEWYKEALLTLTDNQKSFYKKGTIS